MNPKLRHSTLFIRKLYNKDSKRFSSITKPLSVLFTCLVLLLYTSFSHSHSFTAHLRAVAFKSCLLMAQLHFPVVLTEFVDYFFPVHSWCVRQLSFDRKYGNVAQSILWHRGSHVCFDLFHDINDLSHSALVTGTVIAIWSRCQISSKPALKHSISFSTSATVLGFFFLS